MKKNFSFVKYIDISKKCVIIVIMKGGEEMIDFYYQLRQRMVSTMQLSLKQIRQVLGFGVQEFGELIGLTRQSINNLESRKNKMSEIQYLAICAVIDNCTKDKPELLSVLSTILHSNESEQESGVFETIENGSLLKKWFLGFPDDSKIIGFPQTESSVIECTDFGNIANNYKVFLDQTVFLEGAFPDAMQPLVSAMRNNGNKFIVPLKVIEAIQRQMMSTDGEEAKNAQCGMNLLMAMQKEDLVEIRGEKSDVNIISTFVSVFAKFKCVNRLALITCSSKLANQVDSLNNDDIGGFHILILKYSKDHGIQKWKTEEMIYSEWANFDSEDKISDADTDLTVVFKGWEIID